MTEFKSFPYNMSNSSTNILKTGYVLSDKWVIIEPVGKGAMGEVYRAHQLNLKRDVAIKVISQEMLESFEDDSEEIEASLHRFRREVQAMAQVRHPNVLQIFDYGSDVIDKDGKDVAIEYIVMEYIPGATLRFTMSEGGFYPEDNLIADWLVDYFLPLLEGVEAIHNRNIVHRDLKPENILLDNAIPKVADFGLACSMYMQHVTQSVDIRGTPAYMSPEHFFDLKKADRQSDIYSLGKILYEAIDGLITAKILPFKSANLANPDTPFFQKLDQIIKESTAEEKDKRHKSVGDLQNALLEALDILKRPAIPEDSVPSKRLSLFHHPPLIWTGIGIAVLSVVLMGLWHLLGEPGKTTVPAKSPQIARMASDQPVSAVVSKAQPTPVSSPAQSILGKDGINMLFVPGGELEVNAEGINGQQQTAQVSSFYLDEKMVTNHHFAEFLNEVKAGLIVENGVVKNNDTIWFYLGEGIEPQEQIIYKHKRFHLRDTTYASHPVVRVTWYGAMAYAHYYGKRLVTETEWDYLLSKQSLKNIVVSADKTYSKSAKTSETSDGFQPSGHMMHMGAPLDYREAPSQPSGSGTLDANMSDNTYASKAAQKDLKEWILRDDNDPKSLMKAANEKIDSYSSMIAGKSLPPESVLKSFRYPWEAFSDVGFRCALDFGKKTGGDR